MGTETQLDSEGFDLPCHLLANKVLKVEARASDEGVEVVEVGMARTQKKRGGFNHGGLLAGLKSHLLHFLPGGLDALQRKLGEVETVAHIAEILQYCLTTPSRGKIFLSLFLQPALLLFGKLQLHGKSSSYFSV
ncbi:MAG: hypothetical protein WC304_04840 [Candidatus Gracilibacteria bacterium]